MTKKIKLPSAGTAGPAKKLDAWQKFKDDPSSFFNEWVSDKVKSQEYIDIKRQQLGAGYGNRRAHSSLYGSTPGVPGPAGYQSHAAAAAAYAQQASLNNATSNSLGNAYQAASLNPYPHQRQAIMLMQQQLQGIDTGEKPKEPVKKDGTQFGEITGWRMWRIYQGSLKAYSQDALWVHGVPMQAKKVPDHKHEGIWAFKDKERAYKKMLTGGHLGEDAVYGKVRLWGQIVEHEHGYRAEYALIESLEDICLRGEEKRSMSYNPRDLLGFKSGSDAGFHTREELDTLRQKYLNVPVEGATK